MTTKQQEHRTYALLQTAATVWAAQIRELAYRRTDETVKQAVDVAEQLLAEIERRGTDQT
jgi:hypothetical protein